ncbi:EthD domain-containing protein [Elsinoe ampelina]|uniref:EthD domain-containing protein n=1 Tax=Elsinoe ampelina TaxID=302913 RepID=A0A6A6G216_9PEZI|nr:EthD domain-containing protein [Elsinoe ampelina]
MSQSQRLFSVTISAKRKPGMSEDDYHQYISQTHAGHLKELLVQKKIVDYTMQHNTTELMSDIDKLYPNLPMVNHTPYDAFVTIVFRDPQDYIDVKNDPHFINVVNPDHRNFSDPANTQMSFGWFEKHVSNGQLVTE